MLTTAADLLLAGDVAGACGQLQHAHRRTDGDPQPPDFVSGSSAAELATHIQAVRIELGCP